MSNKISRKSTRKLLAASMACVFMISLSSCSAANNGVSEEKEYASVGSGDKKVTITNKELWNEFQWKSDTVLSNQIENVVLNKQITKITTALSKSFANLTEEEKESLGVKEEKEFNLLVNNYKDRLVDYVVQDIYNLSFKIDGYWDDVKDLTKETEKKLRLTYADELYTNYQLTEIALLIENAGEDNKDNYYTIAKKLSNLYVPMLAKELYTKEKWVEEVDEAFENDEDSNDNKYGYFTKTEYVNKFKDEYVNQFDLSNILIRFNSDTEFKETLRAFGLKIVDKEYYYLDNSSLKLDADASYDAYIKAYNDITDDEVKNKGYNISKRMPKMMLDIYVQIYNYVYGGYRTKLQSQEIFNFNFDDLNSLRTEIQSVIDHYQKLSVEEANNFYESSKKLILDNNIDVVKKSRKDLDKISTTFSSYLYDTLTLDSASSSSQSTNNGYYVAYKLVSYNEDDQFKDIYDSTASNDDIFSDIILKKTDGDYTYKNADGVSIFDHVHNILVTNLVTEESLKSKLSDATKEAKVKIYNEACEISYSLNNSDYSKTRGKADSNILATIEYDDYTWSLNIEKSDTENAITYVSFDDSTNTFVNKPFAVFDYFEEQAGATTAIDLISKKIIKTTKAYEKTNEKRNDYKDYIKYILYNFANDGYSSSGYPSSIGKYSFLMLYFHSANIDTIVDNFYRIQYASSSILTDYNSNELIDLFKNYSDKIYDNYFSMTGNRLLVYFDADEDTEADKINDWKDNVVSFEGTSLKLSEVAKQLVIDVYNEVVANPSSHSDTLKTVVDEIEGSARAEYNKNPIAVENKWAKYRKVGLRVKTVEFTVTNSTTTEDLALKERLYSYYNDESYNYFLNNTAPTEYLENLTTDKVLETEDGYNMLIVTTGEAKPSAKWTKKDNNEGLLENIHLKYNEELIKVVDDIYNDDDKLNNNQIKLYVLDYITNGASTLSPSGTSSAITSFVAPVVTRFTSSETQRIVLLNFIKNRVDSTESINNLLTFSDDYKKSDDYLKNIITINQNLADEYVSKVYEDDKYLNNYEDWWEEITNLVDKILLKEAQA